MAISIRQAIPTDLETVRDILLEAANWLEARGEPLWYEDDLFFERLSDDVHAGLYYLAEIDDASVGTVRFELTDDLFWPDVAAGESAFIHRLAVRRSHAGGEISSAILQWAVERTAALGLRYLRLDCARRPKLKAVYERFGFQWHSDREVGQWSVARYEYPVAPASPSEPG